VDGPLRFLRPTSSDHLAAQIVTLVPCQAVHRPESCSYGSWTQDRGYGRGRDRSSRSRLRSMGAPSAHALGRNR
jgi:hypothetical protein